MPDRGRFITLEGGEGAGKSTQARLLRDALEARGRRVLLTREPGGSPGAEALRGMLLSGETAWAPLAETMLHFAARAEHVAKTILPALEAGTWVVCDRFTDSTVAYQGYGRGVSLQAIAALSGVIPVRPDLTLVLRVPLEIGAARLAGRGVAPDRYERMPAEFHARVAAGFEAVLRGDPERCVGIDASGREDEVHRAIVDAVQKLK